ncbi:hypothetical protein [Streptomyces sp. WAC05292]|uniref:hypothetical protein n=1 Tax=Streptomyces sp. WAC05292 TaxID=2487418 RepID=UPI000F7405CD|nr:hypothetical protein [Streptomyces sp. WAC05292]
MYRRRVRAAGGMAALAAVAGLLSGCGSDAFERCVPEAADTAGAAQLAGTFEGELEAKGVRLTLALTPGTAHGGSFTVENWPTGDSSFHAHLGKAFSGSGTWVVDPAGSGRDRTTLLLDFAEPEGIMQGDTLDRLSIGIDAKRTFVYDDPDPDVCPDFRLRLRTG